MKHSNRRDQAAKAKGFLATLTDARCILYMHLLADVLEELTKVSLVSQRNDTCIGEIYEVVQDAKDHLEYLKKRYSYNTNLYSAIGHLTLEPADTT
jgi:hypothetical protein